jgi:hypothetical protein
MSGNAHKVGDDADVTDRISHLEARLKEMERGPRMRARARSRFDRIVPPEAMHHFRSASREQLLGVRTLVDHWIGRIDSAEPDTAPPERETIEVK